MLGFATTVVYATLIAAFSSHTPPPAVKQPVRMYNAHSEYYIWIAPLRKPYSTLAYCHGESIHYFRYTFDSSIIQCIWSTPIDAIAKSNVFHELRQWYKKTSNNELTLNTTEAEDIVAWHLSMDP